MREASLGVIAFPFRMKGTLTSLQKEREEGTSHRTVEPSGTIVRTKVSTLESSAGEGTAVVVRQRPPYDKRWDSTMIELLRESTWRAICGARGRRDTGGPSSPLQRQWSGGRGH
jgi:hypothetical protein